MKYYALIVLFTSCVAGSENEDSKIVFWNFYENVQEPFELSISIIELDNSINLELYLENKADTVQNLLFGGYSIGQPYNFVVLDQDSTLLWQEYKGTIDLVGRVISISPGTELVHSYSWNKDSNFGRKLIKGETLTIYGYGNFNYDWDFSLDLNEPGIYVSNPIIYKYE